MKSKFLHFFLIIFSTSISVFSQTGPGGVGAASSNPFWYDADRLIGLNNNDPVASFTDFSGNNNHATQSISSRRPIYNTNSLNGKPILNFRGSDFLQTPSISALSTNTISWIIVGRNTNTTVSQYFISSSHATSNALWGTYFDKNSLVYGTHARGGGLVFRPVNLGWDAGYSILTTNWRGNTGLLEGYRNGTLQGTIGGAGLGGNGHQFTRLGSWTAGGTGSTFLLGAMSEVIAFNFNINTTQRIIIDNYLAAKYNLAVANDKYAYEATHGNELAGIGRESATDAHTDSKGSSIVRMNSATSLGNGDYMFWGHDGDNLNPLNQTDVPASYDPNSGSRFERIWRVGETGDAGQVTVQFYLGGGIEFGEPNTYELLIDNDGTFTNATQYITGRSYDPATNILTFTGVNFSDGQFFTLGNSRAIISIASGSWSNPATWNCNCIPETGYFTIVDNGHNVTVDVNSTVGTLLIRPTGNLSITNSFSLTLSRNLNNTGTFTPNTGSVVFASSGGAQNISSTSQVDFYDLTINNTSVSSTVSITGGSYTLARALTLTAGDLNTNGNSFTMLSTATETARIAPIPAGSSISGSFIVQRFMTGRAANWHDMASPVQGSTVADWDNEIFMSGVGGPDGTVCCPTFFSVQKYNEPTASFVYVTSTAEPLTPGRGFMVWLGDNMTTWTAKAWDTRGVPTQGDQLFNVNSSGDGWFLVGNPFASFISWDAVHAASTNINATVNVLNNGTYEPHASGTGFQIPAGQGFWIHTPTSGTMRVPESAKTTNTGSTFFKKMPVEFTLKLHSNINEFSNIAKIAMNEESTEEFDYFDGRFKMSPYPEAPAITTYSSNSAVDLSYNSLNSANEYIVIPVKAKVGVSGSYTIDFAGLSVVNEQYPCVLFEDTKTGDIIDLKDKSSYSFDANVEENDTRFKIHMMKSYNKCELVVEEVTSPVKKGEISISKNYVDFNMLKSTDAKISIYNMLGQKVMDDVSVKAITGRVYLNTSKLNGMHFVVVETSENRISEKINFMNF